jgi:hypothetical protein
MPQIKKTYEHLCELEDALLDMKVLLIKEREDIVNLNLPGLAERKMAIEGLFERIRDLHKQTSAQISAACEGAGIMKEQVLSSLISVVPKPDREQFVRLQQAIHRISSEIDNALKVNSGVLEDSLALANQSLTTFAGMLKNSSTYGQAGRYVESVDRSRIINREI